jgi:hypothetical protein
MSNLYELTWKYKEIQNHLLNDDDYPVELIAADEEINSKIENYGFVIRNMESDSDALDAEIERLMDRKKTTDKAIDRMKEMVMNAMKATDKTKLTTPHFKFTVARAGGKTPVKITGDVPHEWCKVKYEPDKDKIRTAMEEDGEIFEFAELGERKEYLRMK